MSLWCWHALVLSSGLEELPCLRYLRWWKKFGKFTVLQSKRMSFLISPVMLICLIFSIIWWVTTNDNLPRAKLNRTALPALGRQCCFIIIVRHVISFSVLLVRSVTKLFVFTEHSYHLFYLSTTSNDYYFSVSIYRALNWLSSINITLLLDFYSLVVSNLPVVYFAH